MLVRSHRGLGAGAALALAALAFTIRDLWSTLARPIPVVVLAAAPPAPPRDLRAGDLERLFGVPPPAPTGVPGVLAVGPDRFVVVRRGEEPPLALFGEWPQARVVRRSGTAR